MFPLYSLTFEMGEQFYAFLPTPCPLEWVDNNLFYLLSTYLSFQMGEIFLGFPPNPFSMNMGKPFFHLQPPFPLEWVNNLFSIFQAPSLHWNGQRNIFFKMVGEV